ncbi:MAG TPA: exodeoxyribonuclease VII large subunit [Acidimicrobiales bacterium]|nr:exodeoxyribonuclease VII large subunit [Acidimicrobiales bacterium]
MTGGQGLFDYGRSFDPDDPEDVGSEDLAEDDPPGERASQALSIAQFYARLNTALYRAFPNEIWVTGEVRKVTERGGHRYLELADHSDIDGYRSEHSQCLEAACWSRTWPAIGRALRSAGLTLQPGLVIRVRGRVSMWEGASKLRFSVSEIDVEGILGGIAAARAKLLRTLEAEGLLAANGLLPLSPVPLRVGLVTSPDSEAYRDFTSRLRRSPFDFQVFLEPSTVQGPSAPRQIADALRRLQDVGPDVAVIVRGGGGKADLQAFDSELVARAIAEAPFPVWTGVGHTGDRSVADEVAARSFITPTACGEALVDRVADYWQLVTQKSTLLIARVDAATARAAGNLRFAAGRMAASVNRHLDRRNADVNHRAAVISAVASGRLGHEESKLGGRRTRLAAASKRRLQDAETRTRQAGDLLRAYDPARQLERGWSLTRDSSGAVVRSVRAVRVGEALTTRVADGELASTVTGIDDTEGKEVNG